MYTTKIISETVTLDENHLVYFGYKRGVGREYIWESLLDKTLQYNFGWRQSARKKEEGGGSTNGLICQQYRLGFGRLYIPLDDMRISIAGGWTRHLSEKKQNCEQASFRLQTELISPTVPLENVHTSVQVCLQC